ncbi:MAG TPA: DNA-binding protein [Elusimicrobia bacterium]|nr:DNA-binding protein [Elusimicrobiota bacterium]
MNIEERIYTVRGHRVMIDRDLAKIFGVSTGRLNEQVKRKSQRFPADFMFQLSNDETVNWISQNPTSGSWAKMGLRRPPYVFTEHGVVMLAAVLNSEVAIEASIRIVRAFNHLRQLAVVNKDLTCALAELARRVSGHDEQFRVVFEAIRGLMDPPAEPCRQIGFQPPEKSE